MTHKGKRFVAVGMLWLVAAFCAAALPTVSGYCETLRFVFLADSRGTSDDDLINTTALNAINSQILALSPRPAFVIFGGDQCYDAYSRRAYNFKRFKDAMKSLPDAGIKLYTVLGNHELYREGSPGFYFQNQLEFQKEFTDNPGNGPPGYERLAYSFESPGRDAFFAVVDCYYLDFLDDPKPDEHGHFGEAQLNWLVNQLAQTQATHKFLFVHAPYYLITDAQSKQNTSFTKLWSILDNNRFDIFFCGHDHLYSRKTINRSIAPDPQLTPPIQWKNQVVQLLNGTCGAPVDTDTPLVDRSAWHVFNNDKTYYFSVVDINGSSVQVTSYGGQASPYQPIDYFRISPNIAPSNYLLLSD